MKMVEKENSGNMDQLAKNARIELEVQYRVLQEEIKVMHSDNCLYLNQLMSIFECEPRQGMKG